MAGTSSRPAICRACRRLASSGQSPASAPRRGLSSSAVRHRGGLLPVFQPVETEELSQLFDKIRERIFIPAHLSEEQRKLVFQAKNHSVLRNEDVYVQIGPEDIGESVKLEPLDMIKAIPDSWKSTTRALKMIAAEVLESQQQASSSSAQAAAATTTTAEEGEESAPSERPQRVDRWANLIPLLEGMRTAGRKWKPWQWAYITRLVGQAGGAHALLVAAQRADSTGLFLYHPRVAREVFWACRARAERDAWSAISMTKALNLAHGFAEAFVDPRQTKAAKAAVRKGEIAADVQPARAPEIIGVALEIAARKYQALAKEGAAADDLADAKAMVKTMAERLAPHLAKVPAALDIEGAAEPPAAAADYELLCWTPVLKGIQATEAVLGNDMPQGETMKTTRANLEKLVADAKEVVTTNQTGEELEKRLGLRIAE